MFSEICYPLVPFHPTLSELLLRQTGICYFAGYCLYWSFLVHISLVHHLCLLINVVSSGRSFSLTNILISHGQVEAETLANMAKISQPLDCWGGLLKPAIENIWRIVRKKKSCMWVKKAMRLEIIYLPQCHINSLNLCQRWKEYFADPVMKFKQYCICGLPYFL